MVDKAKQNKKKFNKAIKENEIIQLNLEGKNLGPSDIKDFITSIRLTNFRDFRLK